MRTCVLLMCLPVLLLACQTSLDTAPSPLRTHLAPVTLPPIDPAGGEGSLLLGGTTPFTVDAQETYQFDFTVGPTGLEAGGGLLLIDPILKGVAIIKYMDWTLDPADCNDQYQEGGGSMRYQGLAWAETDVPGVAAAVDRPEHTEDMHQEMYTEITVDGPLPAGSVITLYLGMAEETPLGPANALCSSRGPYKAYEHVEWRAASRFDSAATWAMLDEDSPVMQVFGGQDVHTTRVYLPSFAQVGETIGVTVALLDEFGNAVEGVANSVVLQPSLAMQDLPPAVDFAVESASFARLEATPSVDGVLRITVQGTGGIQAVSNPCVVSTDPPDTRVYWGDIHSHHGSSYFDEFGDLVDENLRYAQDVAALDFAGESMKLPPLEVYGEELWQDLQAACSIYESDEFVPFLAFEWMGPGGSGHHNVYFDGCFGEVTESPFLSGLDGANGLWEFMDDMVVENPGLRVMSVPHASKYTGFGWSVQDDEARPTAEIFSEWGESIEPDGLRSVPDGLIAGNTMGFIASSDNHDGFMGNPLAYKNEKGGLVAALASDRTRDDIYEAIVGRATYATVVERMVAVSWTEEEGYRSRMGEILVGFEPTFGIEIHGTEELVSATLYRIYLDGKELEPVLEEDLTGQQDTVLSFAPGDDGYELAGPALFYWAVDQQGDGQAWTSPVYLYPDCKAGVDDPAGLCGPADDDDDDDSADDDDTTSADDDDDDDDDTTPADDDDSADDDVVGDDDCSCEVDGQGRHAGAGVLAVLSLLWIRRRI